MGSYVLHSNKNILDFANLADIRVLSDFQSII
jgi:hypothetical protein